MKIQKVIGLVAGFAVSIGGLTVVSAGAASADTLYPDASYSGYTGDRTGDSGTGIGHEGYLRERFNFNTVNAEPGTTMTVDISSCGSYLKTVSGSGSGSFAVSTGFAERKYAADYGYGAPYLESLGSSLNLVITYAAPGKTPYSINATVGGLPYTCPGAGSTTPAASVKSIPNSWVKKYSKATISKKAGKTAKMKKTTLSTSGKNAGLRVSYRWTLNGKVVSNKSSVKTKKAWKNKTLKAQVVLKKSGYNTKIKTVKAKRLKK